MIRRLIALAAAFFVIVTIAPVALNAAPLRAGDHLVVTVFNHPELSLLTATIDGEGKLAMPLAGNVPIAGLEPDAAASRIGDSLKTYLRDPVVSISVMQQNATISVVGGPDSTLAYAPGETLSTVVATLAGIPALDLHRVTIQRDNATYGTYDAIDLLRHAAPGPLLLPGDQVIVAFKPVQVNVLGLVHTPGLRYLDTGSTITDAVNAAGGTVPDAATGAVDILRDGIHQHVALSSDASEQAVHDGDVVTVPEAVHVSVGGLVSRPGPTVLTSGTTLIAAIYGAGGPVQYGDVSHTIVVHDGVSHIYDITKVPKGDASQNPHLSEGDVVDVPRGHYVLLSEVFGAAGAIHWFF